MKKVLNLAVLAMFVLYLITLTYIIVFKANLHLLTDFLIGGGVSEFRSVSFELYFNGKETLLNIAAFIPAGIFLMLLSPSSKKIPKGLVCLLISVAFEAAQYVFMVGTSDLTDIITNTLGGVAGIIVYQAIRAVLKEQTKVILDWLCIPATIAFALFGFVIY